MRTTLGLVLVSAFAMSCASIIGADFNDLKPPSETGGSGGAAASGGSGGEATGGSSETDGGSTGGSGGADAEPDASTGGEAGLADASEEGSGGAVGSDGGDSGAAGSGGGAAGAAGSGGSGGAGGSAGMTDGGPLADADASSTDGGSGGSGGSHPDAEAGQGLLVINEVNGKGTDFIELMNPGDARFNLTGYGITQASGAFGTPSLPDTYFFPPGAGIEAGQYLLVLCNATVPGPTSSCNGWASSCYQVVWGIGKEGEGVFLLTPNTSVFEEVDYPGQDAAPATWGRIPNGTGKFTTTAATPGQANVP